LLIKVLIFDGNVDFLHTISELLNSYGISVVATGSNGKDAGVLYATHKPDVVIIEMEMHEYDGYYAIKKIKGQDPTAKIIVYSSYHRKDDFKEGEVSSILSKTVDFSKLFETIKELCNERRN